MGRLILVGGGARSGKSAFALARAQALGARRVFVATAAADDDEMRARIARHAAERGDAFVTVEAPREVAAAVRAADADVVLVDCLTLWLSNLLCAGATEPDAAAAVDELVAATGAAQADVVVVTNEVGLGIVPAAPLARAFRDVAGRAHQRLARDAAEIYLAALGIVLRIRPAPVAEVGRG